jgi:hypothetical protein
MMLNHRDHSENKPYEEQQQEQQQQQQPADEMYCFPTKLTSSNEVSSEAVRIENEQSSDGQHHQDVAEEQEGQKIIRGSNGFDFVRQPCKARGVEIKPGDNPHVARFLAYIDIPVGTEHGTILCCSHSVCAGSGRRFRYCAYCKTAVAKRNFNVRHTHDEEVKQSRTSASSTATHTIISSGY